MIKDDKKNFFLTHLKKSFNDFIDIIIAFKSFLFLHFKFFFVAQSEKNCIKIFKQKRLQNLENSLKIIKVY
jgi:hypothetical protein